MTDHAEVELSEVLEGEIVDSMERRGVFVRYLPTHDDPEREAALYRVTPPVTYEDRDTDEVMYADYVMISAIDRYGLNGGLSIVETYLFPADEQGRVLDWAELPGSQSGIADIDRVAQDLGWEPVRG